MPGVPSDADLVDRQGIVLLCVALCTVSMVPGEQHGWNLLAAWSGDRPR